MSQLLSNQIYILDLEHYIKVSKLDYAFYLIDSFQFVA